MNQLLRNLLGGASTLLTLQPASAIPYLTPATESRTDAEALRGDFEQIGEDMRRAIDKYVQETTKAAS